MADKLEGSAIVANTVSGDRIVTGSITTTQLAPSVASFVNAGQPIKIRSITYPGNDTAANTGGGQTIVLTGTGFGQNVQVYINSNAVPSVTRTNANSISFTTPALAAATYPVYVINTDDGATAILIPGIQYSGTPTWVTTTPLTTQDASIAWNIQLVATSDSTISYSLQAGSSLPAGITLAANGLISGTMSSPPADETTYNFTVVANDLEQQDASRAFTVSVTVVVLDPYFTYTTLLLHGDGTNNANNHAFVDSSNNNFTITRFNNATQGTFSPFGDNWSMYFDGNDHLNTASSDAFTLGASGASGDFTIEFWMYPDGAYSALTTLLSTYADYNSDFASRWSLNVITASNVLRWYNASGNIGVQTTPPPINTWTHVAIVRSGSTITMYINGTAVGTQTGGDGYTTQGSLKIGYVSGADYFKGYLSNVRIVKGTAVYTSNFTVPTQPLLPISNTSILTCDSSAFVDDGPRVLPITINGNPRITKFDPFKPVKIIPASYGVYFDGTGDYLSIADNAALDMGSSNFTIEGWYFPIGSASSSTAILAKRANSSTVGGVLLYYGGNGLTPSLLVDIGGSWAINQSSSVAFVANQWNHFAIVRNGSAFNLYINGVSGVSATNAGTIPDNASAFTIGAMGADGSGAISPCHISNFRVVKGTAVYTSAFTPQTSQLTAIANTSLLTCQSTTIIDNSTNAFTITRNGDARPTDFNPFTTTFVSEKYNTANNGGAIYSDGVGDGISIPANAALRPGSGDFTIELWWYPTNTAAGQYLVHQNFNNNNQGYANFLIYGHTSNLLHFYSSTTGSSWNVFSAFLIGTYIPNAWNHIVISRTSGTFRTFLNGVLGGSSSDSSTLDNVGNVNIGTYDGSNGSFYGYISGFRMRVGAGSGITQVPLQINPPTNIANTSALLNFTNAGIIDSVGKNVLETVGDARVNTSIKKFGTGSMYFDGTGDYLNTAPTTELEFGSGDFTIEGWIYPTVSSRMALYHGSSGTDWSIAIDYQSQKICIWASSNGTSWNLINADGGGNGIGTITVPLNAWTHIAYVRSGTTWQTYINGIRDINLTGISGSIVNRASSGKSIAKWFFSNGVGNPGVWNGHIDDLRITKGIARYRYNFTPPTKTFNDGDGNLATPTSDVLVGDQVNTPVFPYTTLLLHGDGTNNANNHAFVDSSTNNFAITRNGNATQGTFSPFSPTGWSNYFDGSGDQFTISNNAAFELGSGDFSYEAWVYALRATNTYSQGILSYGVASNLGSSTCSFDLAGATGYLSLAYATGSSYTIADNVVFPLNQWVHVVACRTGSTISLFKNGVRVATTTTSATVGAGGTMSIGGQWYANEASRQLQGYISNARVLKGSSVYDATQPTINVPTTPLTAVSNTSLLTCQSNRFIDNSTNIFTLTRSGDVSAQAFSPFAPSVEYTANTHGGSAYFDGTGDYLTAPSNSAFSLGTGDFTIECWVYKFSAVNALVLDARSDITASPWVVGIDGSNFPYLYDGSTYTSTVAITNNSWTHVVIARSSGTLRMFVNGVQGYSNSYTTNLDRSAGIFIGARVSDAAAPFNGHISNLRIVKGTAVYTATFTPPTAPLTAIANTQLLLSATNAGILDSTGKNILETVGDAKVNTAIKKFGTGSMYFDGTGDGLVGLSTQLASFGTGDFTVESWVYLTAITGADRYLFTTGNGIDTSFRLYLNSTGNVAVYTSFTLVLTSTSSLVVNTWNHVAVCRHNGILAIYINGVQNGTASYSTAINCTGNISVGSTNNGTSSMIGYLDDFRVTKGIARYVTNFTPPTAAFLNK